MKDEEKEKLEHELKSFEESDFTDQIKPSHRHCSFKNFDFTNVSVEVMRELLQVLDINTTQGLYFSGGMGVGKTHLMVAIYRVLLKQVDEEIDRLLFSTFDEALRFSYGEKGAYLEDYLTLYSEVDCLFLDDVSGVIIFKDKMSEWLTYVVQRRHERKLPTFFSANVKMIAKKDSMREWLNPHALSRLQEISKEVTILGRDRRMRASEKKDVR